MKYEEFENMIGKKVVVITQDNEEFTGILTNIYYKVDTLQVEDEIELHIDKVYVAFPFSDIKDIIEIKEEILGLRTHESEGFNNFFKIVQEAAKQRNCVFFLCNAENNYKVINNIECQDLFGWLIPENVASLFINDYMFFNESDDWVDYMLFAEWTEENDSIIIKFVKY
ncbi:MAG: hypothetical protein LUG12_09765 [Erysipelotrichaceae bacterium]|nr:hypothetical protein [Erysipelotrichaceae bacterium]